MESKDNLYYQAMECVDVGDENQALKLLQKARSLDSDYVQTYVGFAAVYGQVKDMENFKKYIDLGFKAVKKLYPKWPDKLEWGFLENRAPMRAIANKAELYLKEGEKTKGIELYTLLLKINPNDNMGIRHLVAGIYAGLTNDDVNEMFDEGNANQDWSKLRQLVVGENKKHHFWNPPEEGK